MTHMSQQLSRRGRNVLVAVTVVALALQAVKLVSRVVLLDKPPTGGQWGQVALVAWLMMSLWGGAEWARVVAAAFYTLGTVVGVVLAFFAWWGVGPAMRWVLLVTLALTGALAATLWWSESLRFYLAERRAASASS